MLFYNERDIEIPAVIEFVTYFNPKSLLDVGAHWSWNYYAKALRQLINGTYDACDIQEDLNTARLVNHYFAIDCRSIENQYDAITCISTLEHCGVKNGLVKCREEQESIFVHLLSIAKYQIFYSFPFGCDQIFEPHYANIDSLLLNKFRILAKHREFESISKFFLSKGCPQNGDIWEEVDENIANSIPINPSKGCQCICLLTLHK